MGYGWMFKLDVESDDAYALSMSDNASSGQRPRLTIEWNEPAVEARIWRVPGWGRQH